jgi:alkanesulfonate monooxygenase SsuD/methylene tetrahydromethanopterin reductase-like flavin-dependent oxidoreductase (luciferase family)
MEFGIFHEFNRLPDWTEAEAFARSFEQVDAAEQGGVDVLWLAELHFTTEYSVLSAPMLVASAIAARTKRIRIGTGVHVLPLCPPLRIAEEVATLDHISNGRLIFGVGRSNFAHVYKAYSIAYSESQQRFLETLEILKLAWTRPGLSYQGTYYSFSHHDKLAVVPRPVQKPYPPIRLAVTSPESYVTAGRLGHGIFIALRYQTRAELAELIRTYREAYAAAGHPGRGDVYVRVPVYVADTYRQARDEPEESFMKLFRLVAPKLGGFGDQLATITYEEALREKIIVGTPGMVAEQLQALREQLELDGIVAEPNSGSLVPHERVMKVLRLLCENVIPRLK